MFIVNGQSMSPEANKVFTGIIKKSIRLRGLKKVPLDPKGPGIEASVKVDVETRQHQTLLGASYKVSVNVYGYNRKRILVGVSVNIDYLNNQFLRGALVDLGSEIGETGSSMTHSVDSPLEYLRLAIGEAIASRSELILSAEKDRVTVTLEYKPVGHQSGDPIQRMHGVATFEEFKEFFRPKKRARKPKTRVA